MSETEIRGKENTQAVQPQFWPDIAEVLDLLAEKGILDPADPADRRRLIEAILEAGGHGARYAAEEAEEARVDSTDSDTETYQAPVLLYDVFQYVRLPDLSKNSVDKCSKTLKAIPGENLRGLIIDLRCASGSSTAGAMSLAADLNAIELPIVVLINETTSHAAELLAQLLMQRQDSVSIGSRTEGKPLPFTRYPLNHGGAIHLPDVNAPGADVLWPPAPVTPDISVDASINCRALDRMSITPKSLVEWLAKDDQMRRAADLLVMVQGVRGKTMNSEL